MATITERKTKTGLSYRIKVSLGYDETYKQITKSMTYRPAPGMTQRQIKTEVNRQAVLFEENTRQEYAEHLKRIEMGLDDDATLTAKRVKFKPLAEEWLNLMETTHEMKPATLVRIKALKERAYQAFGNTIVDMMYRGKEIGIFNIYGNVFMDNANGTPFETMERLIENNPCVKIKIVKTAVREKDIYTLEEIRQLLTLIDAKADLQHKVMFNLLAHCGMRKGELMGLEFKDIDFENNTLSIVRTSNYQNKSTGIYTGTPKTKSSVRELYMHPHLTEMIRQWQCEQQETAEKCGDLWVDSDRLFINWRGEPMRPYYPYKWLKDFCEREGVPFKGLHSFRHTVATESIVNGADVSTVAAILGHSNISTTLNTYTHAVKKAKAKAANLMANLISGESKTA